MVVYGFYGSNTPVVVVNLCFQTSKVVIAVFTIGTLLRCTEYMGCSQHKKHLFDHFHCYLDFSESDPMLFELLKY